jgi:hypothetical protein
MCMAERYRILQDKDASAKSFEASYQQWVEMFKSGSRFSQYSNVGAEVPNFRTSELILDRCRCS